MHDLLRKLDALVDEVVDAHGTVTSSTKGLGSTDDQAVLMALIDMRATVAAMEVVLKATVLAAIDLVAGPELPKADS